MLAIGRGRRGILARCGHAGGSAGSAVVLREYLPLRDEENDRAVCRYAPFSKNHGTLLHSWDASTLPDQMCSARDAWRADTIQSVLESKFRPDKGTAKRLAGRQ